jgi:hypothetical protein
MDVMNRRPGMSLEAGNRRKSLVTLAVTARVLLYRRSVSNFVKRHSELIAIFLKQIRKNQEYITRIIQSLSDEWKITTDTIRVRC